MKKIKIRKQMKNALWKQYSAGHGKSRKLIKDEKNHSPLIHSNNTYRTYIQQCDRFADWCMRIGYKYSDGDLPWIIKDYIEDLIKNGKSAWTVSTAVNAIAHAFNMRTTDIPVELPKRRRNDIKRSRQTVERDRHINPAHYDFLYTFERCFGLRRQRELEEVRFEDFEDDGERLTCTVKGKGGKVRTVTAYGKPQELAKIRRHLQGYKAGLVFPPGTVPSGFDAHGLRAEYAARVYHAHARHIDDLDAKELYICRGDKKGDKYDREALKVVSKMLGHNRLNVVVDHYSYRF